MLRCSLQKSSCRSCVPTSGGAESHGRLLPNCAVLGQPRRSLFDSFAYYSFRISQLKHPIGMAAKRLVLLGLSSHCLFVATSSPTPAPTSLPTVLCDNFTLGGSWSGGKSRYLGDFIYKGQDHYNNPYYQSYQCVGDRSRFYEPQPFYIAYRPSQMIDDKRMWVLTKSPLLDEGNTSKPLPLYWRAESNMAAPPLIGENKW